jgi:hypothetical protein
MEQMEKVTHHDEAVGFAKRWMGDKSPRMRDQFVAEVERLLDKAAQETARASAEDRPSR